MNEWWVTGSVRSLFTTALAKDFSGRARARWLRASHEPRAAFNGLILAFECRLCRRSVP